MRGKTTDGRLAPDRVGRIDRAWTPTYSGDTPLPTAAPPRLALEFLVRRPSRITSALAAVAMAGAGVLVTSSAATADEVTRCFGTSGEVTVSGGLVVPAGSTCVLEGTTVEGRVQVDSRGTLVVTDGTLESRVQVDDGAYFDATGTSVGGNLVSNSSHGIYLDDVTVEGHFLGRGAEGDTTFLYALDSVIEGRIDAVTGEIYLEGTEVGKFVNTEGSTYTDLIDSTVARELTVADSSHGAVVCGSQVDGDATYLGNHRVQIGTGQMLKECRDGNEFGADLTIEANAGHIDVSGNRIAGDLTGTDNTQWPNGAGNTVDGKRADQFWHLRPGPPMVFPEFEQREEDDVRIPREIASEREERRDDARERADQLGPADIG